MEKEQEEIEIIKRAGMMAGLRLIENSINTLVAICGDIEKNAGWRENRDDGTAIALMHSELSEALEGLRKDLMDEHLPNRKSAEVELADTIIRICSFADMKGYNLGRTILEKLNYNIGRPDHKKENREKEGGKSL